MIKPWQGFEIWKEEMMTGHSRLYLSRADVDQMSLDMYTILRLLEQPFR